MILALQKKNNYYNYKDYEFIEEMLYKYFIIKKKNSANKYINQYQFYMNDS